MPIVNAYDYAISLPQIKPSAVTGSSNTLVRITIGALDGPTPNTTCASMVCDVWFIRTCTTYQTPFHLHQSLTYSPPPPSYPPADFR